MKTKFKSLGMALIMAAGIIAVQAKEIKNIADIASEPGLEVEQWMMELNSFEISDSDSEAGNLVEIAVSNPDFSILVEAVTKASLGDALSSDGPFTIFAPTNDAFKSLFKQIEVEGIQDLSAEQLTPILTYHVVAGKVMSSDLTNTSVKTLNGKKIKIDLTDGVQINDSKVVAADISGNNGVIHVIDKVLIPEQTKESGCSH